VFAQKHLGQTGLHFGDMSDASHLE
jgi:hypothetical protein